ncbi:MAG: HIRAN domain-containing protein [Deltaproteobacteria bacterium]|nr:HIRAN domain-containing protein [Deltaproteobacteria bacterium]
MLVIGVFRVYDVRIRMSGTEQEFVFIESNGALTLVSDLDVSQFHLLLERAIRPKTVDAEIRIRMYGTAGERRDLPARTDPVARFAALFLALAHIKGGAILRGLEIADGFDKADELDVEVASKLLDEDERQNVLAEALWSPWHGRPLPTTHPLRALAKLTDESDEDLVRRLREWYGRATRWSSRVVGFAHVKEHFIHLEHGTEVRRLEAGDSCWLVREHDNPVDPNAVMVMHESGQKLGYLRRTIAQVLATHLDRGAIFDARVCAFLPREYPLDERVYLEIRRAA